MAVSKHFINAPSSNGLLRKPMAPALLARIRNLSSGKAVMKMTGMQQPLARSRLCRSRPDRPGICTSLIRHDVSARHPDSRNRSADSKVETACPSDSTRVPQRLSDVTVVIDNANHARVQKL